MATTKHPANALIWASTHVTDAAEILKKMMDVLIHAEPPISHEVAEAVKGRTAAEVQEWARAMAAEILAGAGLRDEARRAKIGIKSAEEPAR